MSLRQMRPALVGSFCPVRRERSPPHREHSRSWCHVLRVSCPPTVRNRQTNHATDRGEFRRISSAAAVWGILLQLGVEPRPRVSPVAISGSGRNAEGIRGLGNRQACEVAKLDEMCLERIHRLKAFEGLVDGQDVEGRLGRGDLLVFDVLSPASTAPRAGFACAVPGRSGCVAWPRPRRRRSGRGCSTAFRRVPGTRRSPVPPTEGTLRGRAPWRPRSVPASLAQLLRGQFAKFVVHKRKELLGGPRVALLDRGKNLGHFIHRIRSPGPVRSRRDDDLPRSTVAPIRPGYDPHEGERDPCLL